METVWPKVVLDVTATDGRARIGTWTTGKSGKATFPSLIFPLTSLASAPEWTDVILSSPPVHGGAPSASGSRIHLVSEGTWFFPSQEAVAGADPATAHLLVPAIQPAPTTTVQLLRIGDELAAFHDAAGWASNPKALVPAFMQARREATPARLFWAPGLGTPQDYALWVYLGVDFFDASPLLLAAARGEALTPDGRLTAAQAQAIAGEPVGTPEATPGWDVTRLIAFNLEQARMELERIRQAIASGTLRMLVERRIYASAASVEILRRFDRDYHFLEAAAPSHRATVLPAMTADALWSPEVEAFRRKLRDRYEPPASAKVLVLLPCSQRKPYKTSRSHRQFSRVLDDSGIRPVLHEVMITSPLGIVPRDIEEIYPATQYDIPVTGHWLRDEEALVKEQVAALLSKHEYDHVVVHTGQATFDIIRHLLPEHTRHTCLHHPTSQEDLKRLAEELARLKGELAAAAGGAGVDVAKAGRSRKLADLRALATFQFGPAVAAALVAGADAHGRMPYVKLERDGVQLGTTTIDRGMLSLTLEGAKVLAAHKTHRVHIGDFRPKGTSSLFAVGVESADPDIRKGDEVVVVHGDDVRGYDVRGCGVAAMSAEEMTHMERGIAVVLRHTAPLPKVATPKDTAAPPKAEVVA